METDIRRTCEKFRRNREIRVLKSNGILSGVFSDTRDAIKAITYIQRDPLVNGIYVTLNETTISPTNRIVTSGKATFPKEEDISRRNNLMVDIDPRDGTTINYLLDKSQAISDHLKLYGFSEPFIACSGNGIHMIYSVNFSNTNAHKILIKKVLKYLSLQFSDESAEIDRNVYTSNRHAKVYGTIVRKKGIEKLSYIIQEGFGTTSIDSIIQVSSNIKESVILANSDVPITNLSKATKDFIQLGYQEGGRNNMLFRAACDFASKGYSQNEALGMLSSAAINSGLSESEVLNTIKSAYSKNRVSIIRKGNYKSEWKAFPYADHPLALEFDIRKITSSTPPWNAFYGETVIKANPGWITKDGVSIDDGTILGIKYLYDGEETFEVDEWLEKIKHGKAYFIHNH